MVEYNTDGTNEIVCPYCGHEHSNSEEWELNGETKIDCEYCDRLFVASLEVSVTYTSKKLAGDQS